MSRWERHRTSTAEDAVAFWRTAGADVLNDMMDTGTWPEWLRVAAGVIREPGSVWEPGCGFGLLATVLPEGCAYEGCDINDGYVAEAIRRFSGPGRMFVTQDFYEVLDRAGDAPVFDWVIVASLLGMFPEEEAYALLPRFWSLARRGMAMTTVDGDVYGRFTSERHEFTSHRPRELEAAMDALPGAARVRLRRGSEFPILGRSLWRRVGLVAYAWRSA